MTASHIPLSAERITWTPPSLETDGKNDPLFTLREPTEDEENRLGYELYRRGIIPISQETFRASIIDEIFNLHGDEEGEDMANLLDEHWQFEQLHSQNVNMWIEQERERLRDMRVTGSETKQAEFPKDPSPIRRRSKAQLIISNITDTSQRMRDLAVAQNAFEFVQRETYLRLYIIGWTGLTVKPEHVKDDRYEILTEECLAALRKEVGKEPIREITAHIDSLLHGSEEERKNSDLPAESEPPPNGSQEQLEGSANSDGSATESNTGPTPDDESDGTTGKS